LKTSLLASASLGAIMLATGAHAADLGARPVYKAPPAPPAPWSWTGIYVGGTIGAVAAHSSMADDPAAAAVYLGNDIADSDTTSVIGGLEAGYNWQIGHVVLGVEGDISWSSVNRTVVLPGLDPDSFSSRLNDLWTVRGRLGWAADRALFYATGGAAFANLNNQVNSPSFLFTAAPSSTVAGWAAGAGFEYALTNHWTAKAEYLHVGFEDRTATDNAGFGYGFKFKDSLDIGRVGINYKF
jgi:outer membrane immunogenic protein